MANQNNLATRTLIAIALIGCGVFFLLGGLRTSDPQDIRTSALQIPSEALNDNDCTEDCTGHEAGFSWAEENDIDEEDACETAGDHSNSAPFAEGCRAFVNGETETDRDDTDADGDDVDETSISSTPALFG